METPVERPSIPSVVSFILLLVLFCALIAADRLLLQLGSVPAMGPLALLMASTMAWPAVLAVTLALALARYLRPGWIPVWAPYLAALNAILVMTYTAWRIRFP